MPLVARWRQPRRAIGGAQAVLAGTIIGDIGSVSPFASRAPAPPGASGFIALGWKDGRLVGIEILDASTCFHHGLLDQAEING